MVDYIPPITAILGSGIVVALLTHWLTVRQTRIAYRQRKLEELSLAAADFKSAMSLMSITIQDVQIGTMTPAEGMSKIKSLIFTAHKDWDKVMMIANIYFPKMVEKWTPFLELRKAMADVIGQNLQFNEKIPTKDFLQLAPIILKLDNLYADFRQILYREAKKL